jgi:MoaA/NifB/PqqE/SkfB family radical SAM enzyme
VHSEPLIRKTTSVCPVCLASVEAIVKEDQGKIFLVKNCPEHGDFKLLLSTTADGYKQLEKFYFSVMDENYPINEYEIWITMRCNTTCAICHLGDVNSINIPNLTCPQIDSFLCRNKYRYYILSGGEPTCREDLNAVIKIFKKHNKIIAIHSNGIKLAEKTYLKELKDSGLDRINLQFDGFNRQAYVKFRGRDILDLKLKVLKNLKELNMPTDLNITVAKEVNEKDLVEIIDYAAKNSFINAVSFFTISYLGKMRDWPMNYNIMPDEVGDVLEQTSKGKISKKDIYLFQKIHLGLKSLLKQRFCFYTQIFILFRKNGTYEPITKFINAARAGLILDIYANIFKKNKFLARLFLGCFLPLSLFRFSSLIILKEIFLTGISFLFKMGYHVKSKKFLYLNFNTSCDPYKIDDAIACNCHDEIIYPDGETGQLRKPELDGFRAIRFEKQARIDKTQNKGHEKNV